MCKKNDHCGFYEIHIEHFGKTRLKRFAKIRVAELSMEEILINNQGGKQ